MVYRETGGNTMNKLRATLMRLRVLVLLTVLLATLLAGITLFRAHASSCAEWNHCPITQRYGHNQEHGVDLWTQGLPVTALRSGTITFSQKECWDSECVMDITWKLDSPRHAGGSPYMYVQIRTSTVSVGEHVSNGKL